MQPEFHPTPTLRRRQVLPNALALKSWPCPVLMSLLCLSIAIAADHQGPPLNLVPAADGAISAWWEDVDPRFLLESSVDLGPAVKWQVVPRQVTQKNGQFSVALPPSTGSRFFRLRRPLTTIGSSSPARGEQGVSVGRETVLRFTAPLAETASITSTNLYATFGGRRLLTRCELASDHSRVSLFYLEPLPGNARVTVIFDSWGLMDHLGLPVDGNGNGQPGGVARIWFDTLNLTPVMGTAVIGHVFAADEAATGNHPLAGVTITVDGREQDLRAVTDANGFFKLEPVPAGRFFVHIDGRTAQDSNYPDGEYYPTVGKAWDAVAGIQTNLAGGTGEIFLPLIQADALRIASAANPTEIGFPSSVTATNPALAAARVTVPPNSLFHDNGTRGGRVGMAPVPSTRLPGPLPDGLDLAMVFTVQTDGAGNFDQPATVCLPNIPEVVAGAPWPPGSRSSLISFDHKKGVWESVGGMTVSADGAFLCTDPGVGIRQPGWHGAGTPPFVGPGGNTGFGGVASGQVPQGNGVTDGTFPDDGGGGAGGDNGAGTGGSPGAGGPGAGDSGGGGDPGNPDGEGSGGGGGAGSGGSAGTTQSCPDGDFNVCLNRVPMDYDNCARRREDLAWLTLSVCYDANDEEATLACLRYWSKRLEEADQACQERHDRGLEDCDTCGNAPRMAAHPSRVPFSRGNLRPASADDDPITTALGAILVEIQRLLAPFGETGDIPATVLAEVDEWRRHANDLAGGDAAAYLRGVAVELEMRLADQFPAYQLTTGNAPSHPLHFVATIIRPAGLFHVRGQTDPYGAYEFFVPVGGRVLRIDFYDPRTRRHGLVFPNLRPDAPFDAPHVELFPQDPDADDADGDGLSDLAEFVMGTNPFNPDTDGDGVPDGTEVAQGADPLDGIAVQIGVLASVNTPGRAVDIVADDNLAVVADGAAGVAIFNIANPTRPVIVAQVPIPAGARAVAMSARHIAVVTGNAGLAIIDLTRGLPLGIRQQIQFGSAVLAVAAADGFAVVGLESRDVVLLDLFTGVQLDRLRLPGSGSIQDLVLRGNILYALTSSDLISLMRHEDRIVAEGQTSAPGQLPGAFRRKRLALVDDRLYASHRQGFTVFDISDPLQPAELVHHVTAQFGWKQIVPVLPNLGLSPGGTDSIEGPLHNLDLYDLGTDGTDAVFLTTLNTPGAAVAVAVWNGLAFVAADTQGLQVVNFMPADALGRPPVVSLADPSLTNPVAVLEGQPFSIAARAESDSLIRSIEFLVDGRVVATAGKYPFRRQLIAPLPADGFATFTVTARATDSAGNIAWSEPHQIALIADNQPPEVRFTVPAPDRHFGPLDWLVLGVAFSEHLDSSTVTPDAFRLYAAGANGELGDADDELLIADAAGYRADVRTAWLSFDQPFSPGRYRAVMTRQIRDAAGNALESDFTWNFIVFEVDLHEGGSALAAGQIERSGAQDILTFQALEGQQIYFDEVIGTCTSGLRWRCVAPDGSVLFEETLGGLGCGSDVGLLTLPLDGTYRVLIDGVNGATNTWSVGIHDVPLPIPFTLDIGSTVDEHIPEPGAGRIETPGATDEYLFFAEAGQAVFFHEPVGTCASPIRWRCLAPSGTVLFDETLGGEGCGRHAGRHLLPETGLYRIVVSASGDATGSYVFTLWDSTAQTFSITSDTEIAEDQPGLGAGRIETPGAVDVYSFSVPPGAQVRFDSYEVSQPLTALRWQLVDETGAVLFTTCLGCTNPGLITLTQGGSYRLIVGGGQEAGTGTYKLRLSPEP